jgi:Ca2+-binding RTX toxin-like protein
MGGTFRFTPMGDYDASRSHELLASGIGPGLSAFVDTNRAIEIGDFASLSSGHDPSVGGDYLLHVPGEHLASLIFAGPHSQAANSDVMSFYLDYSVSNQRARFYGGVFGDGLVGGGGEDQLYGRGGNDTLTGNAGGDFLFGQDGSDTLDYAAERGPGGVIVNMATSGGDVGPGTARDSYGSVDSFAGFENVRTGHHNDRVYGSTGANHISTGAGDDHLKAGAGNDTLNGGSGNDVLTGAHGFDLLHGGPGLDRFVFQAVADAPAGGPEHERIDDFHSGVDKIDLHAIRTADGQPLGWVNPTQLGAVFTGTGDPGQVRYTHGHLQVDMDGDGHRDFEVIVHGGHHQPAALSASDVIFL